MKNTKSFRYTDESKTRDIKTLEKPAVSVTVLIFSIKNNALEVVLVQRTRDPFKKFWSIPGDLVYIDESLENAAKRVLYEKTGLKDIQLEQLSTFGKIHRDPRGRVITVACFAFLPSIKSDLSKAPDSLHASWIQVNSLPKLAFDHKEIIDLALSTIQKEIAYTPLAKGLLPESFTLSDLQKVYEILTKEKLDKRNFRKKILSLSIITDTGKSLRKGNHRPAKLYIFKKQPYV